jgi:AGCS family alanine or glycine:cation symporter
MKGWSYLVGESVVLETVFKVVFCCFVVLGASIQLDAVLGFSDAMVFILCVPNVLGLIILGPVIREELAKLRAVA